KGPSDWERKFEKLFSLPRTRNELNDDCIHRCPHELPLLAGYKWNARHGRAPRRAVSGANPISRVETAASAFARAGLSFDSVDGGTQRAAPHCGYDLTTENRLLALRRRLVPLDFVRAISGEPSRRRNLNPLN